MSVKEERKEKQIWSFSQKQYNLNRTNIQWEKEWREPGRDKSSLHPATKKNIPPVLIPHAEVRLLTERINNGASLSRVLSPLHMMASCVWGSPPAPTGCKNTWSLYLSKHWYSPVNTILEIVGERHKLWHLRMSPGLSWPVLVLVYIYNCQWSNNFSVTCSGFISLLPYRVKWQA